jgi:serine/threonine-protein kinase RsbW
MHDHKTFPARIECLESMIAWVRERIQNSLFREADQRKIELALEEALVNVILHAYPQPSRKAILEIMIQRPDERKMAFKIIDKGFPFNPLLQSVKYNMYANIDEREEGGLGIYFMRQCMDEVHYERHHPFNILTLVKEMG